MKATNKMMPLKSRISCTLLLTLLIALSLGLIATANNEIVIESNDDDSVLNSNEDPQTILTNENAEPNIAQRGSSSHSTTASNTTPSTLPDPALDENSVVLITGAAGFLGSELALALRRTYNVKKLLLVDNLGIESENESAYVPPSANSPKRGRTIYEKCSEEELSMFEIKRQRAFRIFHELTAASLDGEEEDGEGSLGRRNDAESVRFYRADMRPSIPEFFDFGEVPLLEGIFQSHPDITHVVHLADVPISAQNQAIPRNKDSVKTGRMEGLLEEMRLMLERAASSDGNEEVHLPQFVYASSHDVYDALSTTSKSSPKQPNPPPFQEDKPITTPSSLHGTAKLIDEVLASAYHSTHGIYSVGLRFFSVYGPWNAPGTEVFDLAERLASLNDGNIVSDDVVFDEDVKDYVYIDDAVDAIMSAMQYRPPGNDPPPVVFNVGTGKGSTLKEVREDMVRHYPKLSASQTAQRSAKAIHAQRQPTQSYASTSRSESLLGFQAQVPLSEGLAHSLTWHRDRTFPYGRDPTAEESFERQSTDAIISESLAKSTQGTESAKCSPLDRECLRGAPVFPCASECRRAERCTPSAWDDVATLSKMVTSGCDAVLYTILLEEGAEQIPSATTVGAADSLPYVGAGLPADVGKRTQARCNIAFVSDRSPLVRRLKSEGEEYLDEENVADGGGGSGGGGLPPLLRHGFWTVLPVSTPSSDSNSKSSSSWMHAFDGTFALEYLPKVSPGRFLGSSVRYAVYAAPSVLVQNLPDLLKRMEEGPPGSTAVASTALMLSAKRPACDPAQRGSTCASSWTRPAKNDALQSSVYNMIRVALRGDMLGGGLEPVVDSSLLVHSLREEDSRLFRCDVYGEAAQWGASSDERAIEFIVSLHDLWSRAVNHWTGQKIWWKGGGTTAATEEAGDDGDEDALEENRRRLAESSGDATKEQQAGTWMGLLSSSEMQLFTHILPWEGMGIIHLDDDHP
eukprot:CAMPEP_0201868684 /NCGR_PEP_ID=MMETSP0902-20130614/2464_1 /ASSEMBLY_ACC=CAM_ASM_000551 /TAXON_ID=420261 /ORGANISM="Thalassiosira antarctica, Strain CCMP982" /LENGTH=970 /DNA_ID=CAMNT_0048394049 /DNA_START=71 /DNA_END=2983 /DNA_ORIENTATION=+